MWRDRRGGSEAFPVPALESPTGAFPFEVRGFHADNGSERINHRVAKLLNKPHVGRFTKSRARRTNDNAPVEGKNAPVVRKRLGHSHIPAHPAEAADAFNRGLYQHRRCPRMEVLSIPVPTPPALHVKLAVQAHAGIGLDCDEMNLDELRERLSAVDRELISLVAQRQEIVAEVSAWKLRTGAATRDYARERRVIESARRQARSLGLDTEVAEQLMRALIRSSLTHQEQKRVAEASSGAGRSALLIGGSGKMGGWMAGFLASQGYRVQLADPRRSTLPFPWIPDWEQSGLEHDIIVVAAPIKTTAEILKALAQRRPRGLVVDVGSLKTPLRPGFEALIGAGCRVASIHPMFGPNTRLLSGRHVIFVDVGSGEALDEARRLFEPTMAVRVDMSLDEHDRAIAYVLGLSHALNLAFFTALAESGELVPHLQALSSTTFDAQLQVASGVARDNPQLYFEIQALNRFGGAPLNALVGAARRIRQLVEANDEAGFVALMEAGREYLDVREK